MDERHKQLLLVGKEHFSKGEYEAAEPILRDVLNDAESKYPDIHEMLGIIAHARGNLVAAEHHFERALAINPGYTEAALNLAVTYNDRGKYEAAKALYRRIKDTGALVQAKTDPFVHGKLANMHADLGQAYADAGMIREAITEYEKAVVLCPQFADLRTKLGQLLRSANELGRAREHFEAAAAARPSYLPARIQLGVTLFSLGDTEHAQKAWQEVLERDPNNVQAKMYLRMLTLPRPSSAQSSVPPPLNP